MSSEARSQRAVELRHIREVAASIGLREDEIELYGDYKCKVKLDVLERVDVGTAKYVLVTAITPTPLGEGKTVTTIGLSMALRRLGFRAVATLREPSMGPVFGIKGGACGGGAAQIHPAEDINLHFTGDMHAVSAATNLLAAMIDASLWHGNPLNIDPLEVLWKRCVDMDDVALRHIVVGLGGRRGGIPRETGFDITAASEVMAILSLATDLGDLRARLGRIWAAFDRDGRPVTAEQLGAAGAMAALLRDAIKPNLVQASDGGAVFVHGGPFANIAVGTNSILADYVATGLCEYVVTEAGFGADCGAEKFFDIKCRISGLRPACAVIVATVRALKLHGGAFEFKAGRRPPVEEIERPNPEAVAKGCANLEKHIENLSAFGVPVVVAINRFPADTEEELAAVRECAERAGAFGCAESTVFSDGAAGGEELARLVVEACEQEADFRPVYELDWPLKRKIEAVATKVYGAAGVEYLPEAEKALARCEELGLGELPVCIAKTQYSLSHDPNLKGRPEGFTVPVREVRVMAGAGFVVPLLGEIRTMPALPSKPAALKIDIDEQGRIIGVE